MRKGERDTRLPKVLSGKQTVLSQPRISLVVVVHRFLIAKRQTAPRLRKENFERAVDHPWTDIHQKRPDRLWSPFHAEVTVSTNMQTICFPFENCTIDTISGTRRGLSKRPVVVAHGASHALMVSTSSSSAGSKVANHTLHLSFARPTEPPVRPFCSPSAPPSFAHRLVVSWTHLRRLSPPRGQRTI